MLPVLAVLYYERVDYFGVHIVAVTPTRTRSRFSLAEHMTSNVHLPVTTNTASTSPPCCYALFKVEYIGSKYLGWQRQGKLGEQLHRLRSIQETLEQAVSNACQGQGVVCVQASGRTDKGTHALDQRCAFRIPDNSLLDDSFLPNVNQALPCDIHVLSWVPVPPDVSQVFAKKRYRYVIHQPGSPDPRQVPYFKNYSWYVAQPLDLEALQKGISYFVGTHDFRPVSCEAGRINTTRTILRATVTRVTSKLDLPRFQGIPMPTFESVNNGAPPTDRFLILEFEANGFLQHQVRRMTAVLRKIGEGVWAPEMVQSILAGKEYKAPPSAPSRGLYLDRVWLQDEE